MLRPACSGREHATAKTLARRSRRKVSARSGCGSMSTPIQPACSRCQLCDSLRGSLAPTSTKYPGRAPKNSRTIRSSSCGRKIARDKSSARLGRAAALDHAGGRLTGDELDEDYLAALRFDDIVTNHLVVFVVAALDQHLRANTLEQLARRVLVEDDDQVYRLECRKHLGARVHVLHGTVGALETFHRGVTVEPDDQAVAGGARTRQHLDVAGMQKIEAAIGEADAQSGVLPFGETFVEQRPVEDDLFLGRERCRG